MFLINLNAEIVACILSFRKSRHKPNLENTSKYGFSPDLRGKNGGVLSMRMQVILDSSFARPGSAPIWGGKKGEFRDWTKLKFAELEGKLTASSQISSSIALMVLADNFLPAFCPSCLPTELLSLSSSPSSVPTKINHIIVLTYRPRFCNFRSLSR